MDYNGLLGNISMTIGRFYFLIFRRISLLGIFFTVNGAFSEMYYLYSMNRLNILDFNTINFNTRKIDG